VNTVLRITDASDVLVTDSNLATRPRARAGAYNTNRVLELGGAGGNVRFIGNRITAEGDTSVSDSHWAYLGGSLQVTFASNFFWFRASTRSAHTCCGADVSANTGLLFQNVGNTLFTNNTFLGNQTAFDDEIGYFVARTSWPYSGTSSGTNTFRNNYFERFRYLLVGDGALVRAIDNSFHAFTGTVCASFVGCTDVNGLNTGFERVTPGSGNRSENCLLTDVATGDPHLRNNSPCRDTGSADASAFATDLDGQPRTAGPAIDRGADEVQP